jgi:hypothetical protein
MDPLPDEIAIAVAIFVAVAIGFGLLEGSLRWWICRMERSYAAEKETDEDAQPKR